VLQTCHDSGVDREDRPIRTSLLRDARSVAGQLLLRVPRPQAGAFTSRASDPSVGEVLARLRADGIVLLDALLGAETLATLQQAFDSALDDDAAHDEGRGVRVHEDFFHLDPVFLEVALDPVVLAVVANYYRRPFFVGRAELTRLSPVTPQRYGSFRWHHDTRGRQPKAMVLVHDVPEDGQCMRYLAGSHRRIYRHRRMYGSGSRFDGEVESGDPRVVRVHGPGGTVAIFDTNGLHSGNRNEVAPRDTMITYYTTGRNVRDLGVRRSDLEDLGPRAAVVRANPKLRVLD
jgi:Phytanoyl-CoA dioxygenase (PhyH)